MSESHIEKSLTFRSHLLHYVSQRVRDQEAAQDIVQMIFLKVIRSQGPTDPKKLAPWLYRIAKNTIIDFYRQHQPVYSEFSLSKISAVVEEQEVNQVAKCLLPLIEDLSVIDQEAIRLVDFKAWSQKQYADHAGIRYSTAKSRVQRARQHLRKKLEQCCALKFDAQGVPIECNRC